MKHDECVLERGARRRLYMQWWRPETASKAVLLIVHGFGEHSGRYQNIVNTLVPRGFAVYSFDNHGHGRSSGKRGHVARWEVFRSDVAAAAARVREKEPGVPFFIMGHSMGGLIVLEYVLHHPQGLSGMIVSGPALSQEAVSPVMLAAGRVISRIWPSFTMDTKLAASAVSRDAEVVRAYESDPLVHSMGSARLGTEMGKAMKYVLANAHALTLPVLIIHGGADQLVPARTSRELFEKISSQDKTRLDYPGAYHETHNDLGWEKPVAEIAGWLEKHLSP